MVTTTCMCWLSHDQTLIVQYETLLDKRADFNFPNSSNIPAALAYGVYISLM